MANVWAQLSPSPQLTPTPPFPTPAFPTPFIPTPFGTPPGPLLTPTVTPDFRIVNEIIHPASGDAVAGFVPIIGTAVITDFVQYQVHLSPSGAENWSWLATNRKVVRNGILHVLNTYELDDGFYDLRVRAIRRDGNYTEAFLRKLEVRNADPPTAYARGQRQGTPQPLHPCCRSPPQPPTRYADTLVFRSFIENGQGIFEPRNGDIVRGSLTIVGHCQRQNRTSTRLTATNCMSRPAASTTWDWLYTGDQQLWQSPTLPLGHDAVWRMVSTTCGCATSIAMPITTNTLSAGCVWPTRRSRHSEQQDQVSTRKTAPGIYFPLDSTQVSGVMRIRGNNRCTRPAALGDLLVASGRGELAFSG